METLTKEMLFNVNGGDDSDKEFGYAVADFILDTWNCVTSACASAWDWVCNLF